MFALFIIDNQNAYLNIKSLITLMVKWSACTNDRCKERRPTTSPERSALWFQDQWASQLKLHEDENGSLSWRAVTRAAHKSTALATTVSFSWQTNLTNAVTQGHSYTQAHKQCQRLKYLNTFLSGDLYQNNAISHLVKRMRPA